MPSMDRNVVSNAKDVAYRNQESNAKINNVLSNGFGSKQEGNTLYSLNHNQVIKN